MCALPPPPQAAGTPYEPVSPQQLRKLAPEPNWALPTILFPDQQPTLRGPVGPVSTGAMRALLKECPFVSAGAAWRVCVCVCCLIRQL